MVPDAPSAPTAQRLRSLDVSRGLVVALSAILSHIPGGGYGFARHAEWYGLTLLDFIFPMFLTLFGAAIAVAYRKGVRWHRVARRTVVLLVLGLLFNAVIAWSLAPDTWRFTGVLQLFAVVGLAVAVVAAVLPRWWQAAGVAALLLGAQLAVLLVTSTGCVDGRPQPDCNPSGLVDVAVFGADHLYRQGGAGYDPEGLATLPGQVANVLLGYAAGALLWQRRQRGATLALLTVGGVLLVAALLMAIGLPLNKRIWSPSYAATTAAVAIFLLAMMHMVVDRFVPTHPTRWARAMVWLPEAFGRNTLLIYFGKYVVVALLANLTIPVAGERTSISATLLGWLEGWSPAPALTYAALMFTAWALVAAFLHVRRWYITA